VKLDRLNGCKLVADEAVGVRGQVVAIAPQVPPDA
jgi:hypothetical protein